MPNDWFDKIIFGYNLSKKRFARPSVCSDSISGPKLESCQTLIMCIWGMMAGKNKQQKHTGIPKLKYCQFFSN